MKKIIMWFLLASFTLFLQPLLLFGNETDDFRFALGLYSDNNYQLAKSELYKFIEKYSESDLKENAKFMLANIYLKENNYKDALGVFKELHQNGTQPLIRAEVILGLAQSYFFSDNFGQAKDLFTDFSKNFKQHRLLWKAYYYLGRISYRQEDYVASLQHLDRAKDLNPDWEVILARLNTLVKIPDYDVAHKSLERYIETDIHNDYIYQMIVIYLSNLLKEGYYHRVISFAYNYIPDASNFYNDYLLIISEAKIELAQYQKALESLGRIDIHTERAIYLTALCYMETNKDQEAEELFKELSENAVNLEIKTNSYFFLANLRGRIDLTETNEMLTQFLRDNPKHPFIGAAYYQLGINHFRQDKFGETINFLTHAVEEEIDNDLIEKAEYLIAESYFQLGHTQQSVEYYNSYLDKYSDGSFVDEALFKTGLHYFRQDDLPNALVRFDRLINENPQSDRLAMAYFYQGEIFTAGNQYDIAFEKYQRALEDFEDRGLVWLRIAQINFHLGKYDATLENLQNVPDIDIFSFEKETIKGNAYFAKREYLDALKSFEAAENAAQTGESLEDAILRQARTLYRLNEFREALVLHRRLLDMNPKEEYIMTAATVSFTADDFRSSLEFYRRYLEEYPEGREASRAQLHLADSHYNLQEYVRAANNYKKLIRPEIDRAILINSLNGLEWSARQDEEIDFEFMIKNILTTETPLRFRLLLKNRLLRYFYDKANWEEAVNLARTIIEIAPQDYEIFETRMMMAKALTHLNLFNRAEEIYQALHSKEKRTDVLYNWGELHLLQQDSTAALTKIGHASELTNDSDVWLRLLQLGVKMMDERFLSDYEKYLTFSQNVEREQAKLLWIEWNLQKNDFDEVVKQTDVLLESEYEPIKARAQYYKGVHLYKTGQIQEAIPELLRVRYLYPRVEDVRLDAELLACYAYIEIGDLDNSRRLFDTIKDSLPEREKNKLKSLLPES